MPTRRKKAESTLPEEPPPAQALRLTHTRLLVENMDVCYKFYRDTLGFRPKFDGEGSVYAEFDLDGHTLALFARELMNRAIDSGAPASRGSPCDSVLLAIEVNDVDRAYRELTARGVRFLNEPHNQQEWLLRVAHFRDPDGNLLEINAALAQAPDPAAVTVAQ